MVFSSNDSHLDPFELGSNVRTAFLAMVEESLGLRLTDDQAKGLGSSIHQLAAKNGYATPVELYNAISNGSRSDLLKDLVPHVTNGETHFFRVSPQIEALRQVILPDLLARRSAGRKLRLWSAGCSTGEEPYTLAILLREHLAQPDLRDVRLLATDVNEAALASAAEAIYGEWAFRETPAQVRQWYFTPAGKRWELIASIREMVSFARHNLAADPFPSPGPDGPDLDLIVCRNVTIYFGSEATRRLYSQFADALVPDGWLLLGPSDPTPQQPGPFEPVHIHGAVAWRRTALAPVAEPPRIPFSDAAASSPRAPRHSANIESLRSLVLPTRSSNSFHDAERDEPRLLAQSLDAEAHVRHGLEYLEAGEVSQAIESLRRATFLQPHNALAHFGRGRACLQIGDRQGARVALNHARRALAVLPDGQAVPGGEGLTADELRRAVDVQLEAFLAPPPNQKRSTG